MDHNPGAPDVDLHFDEAALQEVRESRLLINLADDWLFEEFGPHIGHRLVEVGCGLGNHLSRFQDRELLLGIDISESTIDQIRQRFDGRSNVRLKAQSITDPAVLEFASLRFDTAISENVFEHIADDGLAMRHVHELLQPGGKFVIIVPAHQQIFGTMDRSIGHYRRYTKSSLRRLMLEAGFTVVLEKYINALGALGWLVSGRLLRRRTPPRGQLRLLNHLIPTLRAAERWVEPPFGVSLLMVGQKAHGNPIT